MNNFDLILNHFTLNPAASTTDQTELNNYIAWLVTTAKNSEQKTLPQPETSDNIQEQVQALFDRYAVDSDIVNKRYVLPLMDLLKNHTKDEQYPLPPLFQNIHSQPEGDNITVRTEYFQKVVTEYLDYCYQDIEKAPDEIIHVTSMGWILPSPLQRFLTKRGWDNTLPTHSYFYGCFGSIPGLRNAVGGLLSSYHEFTTPKDRIDIVHTEFLTIHMGSLDLSPDSIISATLFSDGFAKYSLYRNAHDKPTMSNGLKVICFHEKLLPNSSDEMMWVPRTHQYSLYLSIKIPGIIGKYISDYVNELCKKAGFDFETEKNNLVYAIHPGGESILEVIQRKLNLRDDQIQRSRKLLYDCGNISSASLPYLWDDILNSTDIKSKTKILTLSFGPGMTAAGAILEKL